MKSSISKVSTSGDAEGASGAKMYVEFTLSLRLSGGSSKSVNENEVVESPWCC